MNPALNREASEARAAELRRRAGRDAIALAGLRAATAASANPPASKIAAMLRLLRPRRIHRTLPRVIAADLADRAQGR
jgi:propanediol dehydratase small subunit